MAKQPAEAMRTILFSHPNICIPTPINRQLLTANKAKFKDINDAMDRRTPIPISKRIGMCQTLDCFVRQLCLILGDGLESLLDHVLCSPVVPPQTTLLMSKYPNIPLQAMTIKEK